MQRCDWAKSEQMIRYHDKEWSYTDCGILAVAQLLDIGEVFAYDRHFDQMPGIRRVG